MIAPFDWSISLVTLLNDTSDFLSLVKVTSCESLKDNIDFLSLEKVISRELRKGVSNFAFALLENVSSRELLKVTVRS